METKHTTDIVAFWDMVESAEINGYTVSQTIDEAGVYRERVMHRATDGALLSVSWDGN